MDSSSRGRWRPGRRLGDRVEITKGLKPGERIVVSGNFLIDSESKMKMAAAGMHTASQNPQATQQAKNPALLAWKSRRLVVKVLGLTADYQGKTYYFCTEE